MLVKIKYDGKHHSINLSSGIDLSIKNDFLENSPLFYGAHHPKAEPFSVNDFIGDISHGGSCNVNVVSLNIHCTGTHTESIAHILDSNELIPDVCPIGLIPAYLVSIDLKSENQTNDSYHAELSDNLLITSDSLRKKITTPYEALIIRTIPNDISKISRNYDLSPAPFFTNNAVDYINELKIQHLLVDIPSIDKADDGGELGNHRRFFKQGKTISELLYIPESIADGFGFLSIQIPNWSLDAAPSRPIFYPV